MYTWWIYNQSTGLPVVEPDNSSTMSKDEARKAAAEYLLAEANGLMDDETSAEILDNAAQELNYADVVSVGGTFDWEVTVCPVGVDEDDDDAETFKIVRYYAPGHEDHPDNHKIVARGLSLAEAQAHCQDPSTREPGVWFDGYTAE